MSQNVLTITQINEYIRTLMDQDVLLMEVTVKGEISNYKIYPSGHHYFTLKDDGGALKCVMFRSSSIKLKFRPENGMKVIALGRITVYPRDGAYQLYCNTIMLDGIGDLHAAFEQLKKRLAAQGLFDSDHKKNLPQFPGIIGIVTSPAGAAVHDMLRILRKRYPLSYIRLLPVRVQGEEAPSEIAAAIRYANLHKLADLLIVGRGGGSIEDLWAFNDELVAKAIYNSQIPIISAVGHEPDVTISDYVADLRAATPSNAAELAVPDQDALRQYLDVTLASLSTSLMRQLRVSRQHLDILASSPAMQSPDIYLKQHRNNLKNITNQLLLLQNNTLGKYRSRFLNATAKLDAMSPLKVLTRGYAIVQTLDREVVRSTKQLSKGSDICIAFTDGDVQASITEIKENDR